MHQDVLPGLLNATLLTSLPGVDWSQQHPEHDQKVNVSMGLAIKRGGSRMIQRRIDLLSSRMHSMRMRRDDKPAMKQCWTRVGQVYRAVVDQARRYLSRTVSLDLSKRGTYASSDRTFYPPFTSSHILDVNPCCKPPAPITQWMDGKCFDRNMPTTKDHWMVTSAAKIL